MNLELANKRLQLRIVELEQEVINLKQRLSDSQIHLNRAHEVIAEIREIKRAKQVKADTSNKIVLISQNNPNKGIMTDKQKIKKRCKLIYGILKNPKGYNLSELEKNFLVSIESLPKLSQKQFDWLESIKKRLKNSC